MIQLVYVWCDKILRNFFLAILVLYRRYISPDRPGLVSRKHCRYWPSCSVYASQAFQRYPFLTAVHLSSTRVLRCNPWHKGGYDPLH